MFHLIKNGLPAALILLAFVEQTLASSQCLDLFSDVSHNGTQLDQALKIEVVDYDGRTKVPTTKIKTYTDVVLRLNRLLGRLRLSELFIIEKEGAEGFFEPERSGIKGLITVGKAKYFKTVDHWLAVFIHEAGHAIARQYFKLPFLGQRLNYYEAKALLDQQFKQIKESEAYRRILTRESELNFEYRATQDVDRRQQILDESQTVRDSRFALLRNYHKNQELLDRMREFLVPYEEIMSDALAVLYFKNNQIMAEATGIPLDAPFVPPNRHKYRENNPQGPRPRAFVLGNFKNWRTEEMNRYTQFDPVRGHLWDKFLKDLTEDKYELFFQTFLKAMAIHMDQRFARGESDIDVESRANLNQINGEFLGIITAISRKNGLMPWVEKQKSEIPIAITSNSPVEIPKFKWLEFVKSLFFK